MIVRIDPKAEYYCYMCFADLRDCAEPGRSIFIQAREITLSRLISGEDFVDLEIRLKCYQRQMVAECDGKLKPVDINIELPDPSAVLLKIGSCCLYFQKVEGRYQKVGYVEHTGLLL